jgi:hypothetical protein
LQQDDISKWQLQIGEVIVEEFLNETTIMGCDDCISLKTGLILYCLHPVMNSYNDTKQYTFSYNSNIYTYQLVVKTST